jgi:hypothetical protein
VRYRGIRDGWCQASPDEAPVPADHGSRSGPGAVVVEHVGADLDRRAAGPPTHLGCAALDPPVKVSR